MSDSWGWKLATEPDDAMNFLNGTGAYKTPVEDAKICAVWKGILSFNIKKENKDEFSP